MGVLMKILNRNVSVLDYAIVQIVIALSFHCANM